MKLPVVIGFLSAALVGTSCSSVDRRRMGQEEAAALEPGQALNIGRKPTISITEAEAVEIAKRETARLRPSTQFKVGRSAFSEGRWAVIVSFLPKTPGGWLVVEISQTGEIIRTSYGY